MTDRWEKVGLLADMDEDEPLAVKLGGKEIGVYIVDGQVHAIEDVCPHAYTLLSQGFVDGEEIECPLHGAIFHIPTGKCLAEPAERDLETYDVRVENGEIFVKAPESAERENAQ